MSHFSTFIRALSLALLVYIRNSGYNRNLAVLNTNKNILLERLNRENPMDSILELEVKCARNREIEK